MRPTLYRTGDLVRIRDERWRIVTATAHDTHYALRVSGCDPSNAGVSAVFLPPADRVQPLVTSRHPRIVRPRRWRRVVRGELAAAAPAFESLRAAAGATIDLLPFQLEPALAVTRGVGTRLLIADVVGLGKTVQAGLIVAEQLARAPDRRALVVTPAAVRDQWCDELRGRFGLEVVLLDAPGVARTRRGFAHGVNPWAAPPVVIASIDFVKRPEVMRGLDALVWDVIVFDEAHALAGASDRAAAAHELARRARVVVLLTATPHTGDVEAFARLCRIGRLRDESPLLFFRRTRADLRHPSARRTRWLRVRLSPAEREMHELLLRYARLVSAQRTRDDDRARLAMTVLLKRACSSPMSLARSIERRLALLSSGADERPVAQLGLPFAADDEPVAMMAAPGLNDRAAERRLLEGILTCAHRATVDERKLNVLARLLRRTREPAIVFTEYRDTLEHVARRLARRDPVVVHGGLTTGERRAALRRFTTGASTLLLATDAASEGLNLHQRCRRVINIELPWTPLRLEQRAGRVDRIGQTCRVHATHLVAGGTAEDGIVAQLLSRMTRAADALTALSREPAGEDHIAGAILDDRPPPTLATRGERPGHTPAAVEPQGIIVPDLRQAAACEAARLLVTRALTKTAAAVDTRPVLTRLRRGHGQGRWRLWGVRVRLLDETGTTRWSTILGIAAGGGVRRTFADELKDEEMLGRIAALPWAPLEPALAAARAQADAAIERECDIVAALHRSGGSGPVPLGLFDHRAEREAATRSAAVAGALERCARHLTDLHRLRAITAGEGELVFAAAFR